MVEPSPADAGPDEGPVHPDIEDASVVLMIDVAEATSGGPRVAPALRKRYARVPNSCGVMSEPVPEPPT
jgi:hypothetical protein